MDLAAAAGAVGAAGAAGAAQDWLMCLLLAACLPRYLLLPQPLPMPLLLLLLQLLQLPPATCYGRIMQLNKAQAASSRTKSTDRKGHFAHHAIEQNGIK